MGFNETGNNIIIGKTLEDFFSNFAVCDKDCCQKLNTQLTCNKCGFEYLFRTKDISNMSNKSFLCKGKGCGKKINMANFYVEYVSNIKYKCKCVVCKQEDVTKERAEILKGKVGLCYRRSSTGEFVVDNDEKSYRICEQCFKNLPKGRLAFICKACNSFIFLGEGVKLNKGEYIKCQKCFANKCNKGYCYAPCNICNNIVPLDSEALGYIGDKTKGFVMGFDGKSKAILVKNLSEFCNKFVFCGRENCLDSIDDTRFGSIGSIINIKCSNENCGFEHVIMTKDVIYKPFFYVQNAIIK